MKDSVDNILKARSGEQCASKLTEAQAREVLRRRTLGRVLMAEAHMLSNRALGEKYDIHAESVRRIIKGDRWKGERMAYGDMTYDDALTLRAAAAERDRLKTLAKEHSVGRVAEDHGISKTMVGLISNGSRWLYLGVRG